MPSDPPLKVEYWKPPLNPHKKEKKTKKTLKGMARNRQGVCVCVCVCLYTCLECHKLWQPPLLHSAVSFGGSMPFPHVSFGAYPCWLVGIRFMGQRKTRKRPREEVVLSIETLVLVGHLPIEQVFCQRLGNCCAQAEKDSSLCQFSQPAHVLLATSSRCYPEVLPDT